MTDDREDDGEGDVSLNLATLTQMFGQIRRRYRNVLLACEGNLQADDDEVEVMFTTPVSGLGLAETARVIIHSAGDTFRVKDFDESDDDEE